MGAPLHMSAQQAINPEVHKLYWLMKSSSVQTDISLEMTGHLMWVGRFSRDVKHYKFVELRYQSDWE